MSHTGWLLFIGITLLIELFLIWRILRALNIGSVRIDPLFWLGDSLGFAFTVNRAANPIFYWLGALTLMALAALVLVVFAVITVVNLR